LSPATRVSLSLDLSRAPVGYLAADGPVERTTIDCAAAAVTMVRAATAAAAVRPRRRIRKSGKDIAFSPFGLVQRSEEHTSELQSLMRISYAVFCLQKKI